MVVYLCFTGLVVAAYALGMPVRTTLLVGVAAAAVVAAVTPKPKAGRT